MLNLFYAGVNKSHFEPVNRKDLIFGAALHFRI